MNAPTPDAKLPELPNPGFVTPPIDGDRRSRVSYFTADQMHAYAREAIRTAAGEGVVLTTSMLCKALNKVGTVIFMDQAEALATELRAALATPEREGWRQVPVEFLRNIETALRRHLDRHAPRQIPVHPADSDILLDQVRDRIAGIEPRDIFAAPAAAPPSPPDAREDSNEN